MRTKKLIHKLLVFSMMTVGTIACTDEIMDDINVDKNHPLNVQAKLIIPELITSTAFSTVGGDFSLYASVYVEHETGVHNQMYNAEVRQGEPTLSTTYNNAWSSTYANIKLAKIVIAKSSAGGEDEGNEITLGAAKVLLAYNAAVLTDLFGDVPFSEAGEINPDGTIKYMQPKIDKQEDIYATVFQLLDEAIVHFDGTDAGASGAMGSTDLLYGGNKALWKKAAYGLKARYTMRLLARSADQPTDLTNVIDYVDKSFTSANEEMKFDFYDGDANVNPLAGFDYSRDALGASKSLVTKYIARNDPRGSQAFMNYDFAQITNPAEINVAPNGAPTQVQFEYDLSMACYAFTAPTMLLSYHELLFLKAEALCRLSTPNAQVLKDAIIAGFANLQRTIESAGGVANLDAMVAQDYFTNTVQSLFTANPLKETMEQKYFAFAGASGESIESYNDYRRVQALGEDFITLNNPKNATQFPLRFSYGNSDVLANTAVQAAYGNGQYVYSEKVWWAGGTR